MSATLIVLGIVAVLVVYAFYVYIYSGVKTLSNYIDCTSQSTTVKGTTLASPTGVNFAYGMWVYVSSYTATNTSAVHIMYRKTDSTSTYCPHIFFLGTTPTLMVQFINTDAITSSATTNRITVTDNFPLQKWVCIVVSLDAGKTCDVYLDGKMVQTFILSTPVTQQPAASYDIVCGPFGGYMSNLKNWNYPMDPNSVWSYYMGGNGRMNILGNYGLQMEVTKDEEVYKTMRMF